MAKLRVDKIASVGVSTETTGSVFFDGSSDWLRARGGDNFSDFDFGSNDFTIEGFFYANDVNGIDIPIALAADSVGGNSDAGWYIRYHLNKIEGQSFSGSDNIGITTSGTVSNDTWYHVAYVREGPTFTLYVDGVAVDSSRSTGSLNWNSGWKVEIGSGYGGANYFAGYISNLRICKGHAVYKSNFAVPTRELDVHPGPDDDRTVLLACYDGENIFAEKTGRHILASQGNRSSSPTLAAGQTPVGITTFQPGLDRDVDNTFGPSFQGGAGYNSQNWLTLPKGTTTERFVEVANNAVSASSARGIFQGGQVPGNTNTIEYITIGSLGNGTDFGDMTVARQYRTSVSSSTRGVTAGGDPTTNIIDYITISTLGNAKDFGDLFTGRYGSGGCSSGVRGVWAGGFPGSTAVNTIDFVTIASTGNANDFGDLTAGRGYLTGCGSPSRGLFAGGITPTRLNTIDFITIASMGNAFDFGDLTSTRGALAGCSSSTRGLFAGGSTPTMVNTIDYAVISTTGNAVDFGDQSVIREGKAACSSSTRGVWGGGSDPSNTKRNTIDYVELATLGNAIDFGDLTVSRKGLAGCSNGHGGLG